MRFLAGSRPDEAQLDGGRGYDGSQHPAFLDHDGSQHPAFLDLGGPLQPGRRMDRIQRC